MEDDTAKPRIANTTYEDGVLEVLSLVRVRLPGSGWWWHTADYEEGASKGAVFSTIDEETKSLIAQVLIVDASLDPDEPDVTQLKEGDLPAYDAKWRRDAEQKLSPANIELVDCPPSLLNENNGQKALVSVHVRREAGVFWKHFYARMNVDGRKIIVGFLFDVRWHKKVVKPLHDCLRHLEFVRKPPPSLH